MQQLILIFGDLHVHVYAYTDSPKDSVDSPKDSVGGIVAGTVVGGLVLLAVIIGLVVSGYLYFKWRTERRLKILQMDIFATYAG